MSNDIVNIRLFSWHLQIKRDWHVEISYNGYHKASKYEDGYFRVYTFPGCRR